MPDALATPSPPAGNLAKTVDAAAQGTSRHIDPPPIARHDDPRFLNIRGQRIQTHRALRRFDFTASRILSVFLLPAILSALVFFSWPLIDTLWSIVIQFFTSELGPDITLARHDFLIPGMTHVPYPLVDAGLPSITQWWSGMAAVAVLLAGPALLPERMLPLTYLARFIGMLQLAVQCYFYFWPGSFPHHADSSIAALMQASLALMLVVPWLFGFTYNIFGFSLFRKIALSVMAIGYLIVLTPVQFTLAALLLQRFSMLWHPLIYLLGTTLLQLVTLLALYAWAMSWKRPRAER
jgi:hypothetical protein